MTARSIRILPCAMATLAIVGVLKIGFGTIGLAGASAQSSRPPIETPPQPAVPDFDAARREASPPSLSLGENERRILERLALRRRELEEREAALDAREAVVAASEQRLADRLSAFAAERADLEARRAEIDAADAEEIEALASAYERMRARDAAAIFNELDEDILLRVVAGMRTQALAGVLAEMAPDKARRLTTLLADERPRPDAAPE